MERVTPVPGKPQIAHGFVVERAAIGRSRKGFTLPTVAEVRYITSKVETVEPATVAADSVRV